jgi:hypothetical protein
VKIYAFFSILEIYSSLQLRSIFLSFADAFDTDQLLECMGKLKSGQSVNIPIYDFKNHRRCSESFRKVVIALLTTDVKRRIFVSFMI